MDDELIEATGKSFEDAVGTMWEDTVDTYEQLNTEIELLAMSRKAGYFDSAKARFQEQGVSDPGDGEIMLTSRQLVHISLSQWATALELQKSV